MIATGRTSQMKRIVAVALAAMLLGTPAIAQDLPS
jgi:hypothetical protein